MKVVRTIPRFIRLLSKDATDSHGSSVSMRRIRENPRFQFLPYMAETMINA